MNHNGPTFPRHQLSSNFRLLSQQATAELFDHLSWLKFAGIEHPFSQVLTGLPNFGLDEKIGRALLNGAVGNLSKDLASLRDFVLLEDFAFMPPVPNSMLPIYITFQLRRLVAGYIRVIEDLTSGRPCLQAAV